jgi:vacuolar-type H+-ATPase subunit E/Vma4
MSEADKFTEDILRGAKEKAESIIREAESERQRVLDESQIAISRETEGVIRAARADAEAVKRRQVSEARHRAKLSEQKEKDKIMQEVLDQAKKRTFEMVRDETKYIPLLTRLIESGIHELGERVAVIHLNEQDLRSISSLELRLNKDLAGQVKVDVSKDPIVAAGGAIISTSDGKIRVVNTLDQRFEALEPSLLIEARKFLFGD